MRIHFRNYKHPEDYNLIGNFLLDHYQPGNADRNWIQPIWEYMHFHPYLDSSHLDRIAIWEEEGLVIGAVHYESRLGEAFFQFHPAYRGLRAELLDYAEANLAEPARENERKVLRAYVSHDDAPFIALLQERGYTRDPGRDRPMAAFTVPDPFPEIWLPDGFCLKSLADEPDWGKVHRVMYRGFNHPGEPDMNEEELVSRQKMFDTPTARRDLKIVVQAPNGEFASFCGMFVVPSLGYALVEPVATDPAYRRLGLGKAAVLEGIRRCAELGARVAYVGSDQEFYLAIGFQVIHTEQCWVRHFD